jgi:carbamoyl-phosphate synthase large subunit
MRHPHVTILRTGAGTATTLSVIKGVRQQKEFAVRVITCDRSDNVSGRYMSDAFYKIPSAEDPKFLSTMLRIVKKEHVNMVIPIVDYEFKIFAGHKAQFEKLGATVVFSDLPAIEICTDKFKTMKLFESLKLAHPKSYTFTEAKHLRLRYPLFLKPSVFGRSTIDAYTLTGKKDLLFYGAKVGRPIIQEFVSGVEITIDALNDFHGHFIFAVARIRTETKGGLSIKGVVIRDDKLMSQVKRITEAIGIIGPCNIQCFRRGSKYVFSEVNPRFAGAQVLSIQAGFNSIQLLCKLYSGKPVNPQDISIQYGLKLVRYWEELFVPVKGKAYQPDYKLVK